MVELKETKDIYRPTSNIINYQTWVAGTTGSQPEFPMNGATAENAIVLGLDPWDKEVPLWECRPDAVSNSDGGWNGSNFPIDRESMYRFSVWVKKSVIGLGNFYVGTHGYDHINTNISIIRKFDGANSTNPYFYGGDPKIEPEEWYLFVGHVWQEGTSTGGDEHFDTGIYTRHGRYSTNSIVHDWIWNSTIEYSHHRCYLYYTTHTSERQWMVYPRFDKMDGTEPSIQELLDGYDSTTFDDRSTYSGGNKSHLDAELEEVSDIEYVTTPSFQQNKIECTQFSELGDMENIIGYWPLDKDSKDYSGNGVHGTETALGVATNLNRVKSITGKSAVEFGGDPAEEIIRLSGFRNFLKYSYTVSLWFYCRSITSSGQMFGGNYNSSGFSIVVANTGNVLMRNNDVIGDTTALYSNNAIQLNYWHHLLCIFNSQDGVMQIYLNGELDNENDQWDGTYKTETGSFSIGSDDITDPEVAFDGYISDVRLYKGIKTDLTAKLNYGRKPMGVTSRGLISYWHFDNSNLNDEMGRVSNIDSTGQGMGFTTGIFNKALQSFSDTEYLAADDVELIPSYVDGLTISLWAKFSSLSSTTSFAFETSTNGFDNTGIKFSDFGNVIWTCGTDGISLSDSVSAVHPTTNQLNTWHHWTFTKHVGSGVMAIYHDGNLLVEAASKEEDIMEPTLTTQYFTRMIDGFLDDVRIYDRYISLEDNLDIMHNSIPKAMEISKHGIFLAGELMEE